MEELTFVLLGAILVTYGWYWGGVAESRTTGVAVGVPAIILAGITFFQAPSIEVAAVAATGAVFGGIVAMAAMADGAADRGQGLFALFAGIVAILGMSVLLQDTGVFETNTLAYLVLALAYGFIFISAGLVPAQRGFRSLVGWITLVAGAIMALLAFAPALAITFN